MTFENKRNLRILIITHFYPPEMGAAAARMHGLARWLVKGKHNVTTLTGFPNYPTGRIPRNYRWKFQTSKQRDGVNIIRTWVFATSHHSSVKRILNYISFVLSSIITGILLNKRFDILLVSTPPLFIGITGSILSKLYKIPFVLDIRDIWPDVAIETGAFKEKSLFTKLSRLLTDFIYNEADHLTPVTKSKLDRLRLKGIEKRKTTVVTNGVDFDRLDLSYKNNLLEKLNISTKFVITYTGLIGIAQGIGIAVDAARHLKHNPEIHFIIVGEGVEKKFLIEKAKKLKLTNITFVARQPRKVIPSIIAASDLALVPLVSGALRDAVPSKLLEAWACRKAVLLAAEGEAADLVRESGGGVVISPGKPKELVDAVTTLFQNQHLLIKFADDGYNFVSKQYNRRQTAKQMENVLKRVVMEN